MDEKKKLIIFWLILIVLLAGGLALASKVTYLPPKEIKYEEVLKLLMKFFVLALFVERTIEVFITAWRGEETVKRENELQAQKQALAMAPTEVELLTSVKEKANWLAEYKCETKAIALRSALVLGILVAAVGVRSFDTFAVPVNWWNMQYGTFRVLDVLISGGIVGGGSDAIHKMINVITEFFDATVKKLRSQ